jgi:hypothetical protein
MNKLGVILYNNDLSSPVYQENLEARVQNLKFSTKLNGGFNTCSFGLNLPLGLIREWVYNKYFYRIKITDGFHTFWEGRIQDPAFDLNVPQITAYGYYASLNDQVYNTAFNAVSDTVIKAILTACCPSISSDQSHINPDGLTMSTIDSAGGTQYADVSAKNLIELLLKASDTTNLRWYAAVWEDRIMRVFTRPAVSVDWRVRLRDLRSCKWAMKTENLWNNVYAIYTAGGALTSTAESTDADSISRYGLTRKYAIPQMGTVAAASAQAARSAWLNDHKDIWPDESDIVLGNVVYDSNGVAYPSSRVRAGQYIQIVDLLSSEIDASSPSRNALNTFYITQTEYDLANMTNSLIIEREDTDLTALLAKERN